jgi:putative nucleotidyltransferase with HDIG domain
MPEADALGTPAVGTYKAARDYEIADPDATQRLRDQAVAAERPVYDFDDGAIEEAASRVRGAFRSMRDGEPRRPAAADLARFEVRLGAPVREAWLAAFAEARFSDRVESQVVALAARALAGLVVDDGARLAAEERGIVVRTVRFGAPQGEHAVFDLAIVRDAAAAREDVLRARAALPAEWPPPLRDAVVGVAAALVRPTLTFNGEETAARRGAAAERVKPVTIRLKRGEKIVGDGEPIEQRHLVVFRGIEGQTRRLDVVLVRLGGAALVATLLLLLWRYARRNVASFAPTPKDAVLLACAFVATLACTAAGLAIGDALHDRFPRVPPEAFYLAVPWAAGAMVIRSVLSAEIALLFALATGAAVGLLVNHSLFMALQALLTGCAAAGLVARTRDRAGLFRVGAAVGAIGAGLAVASHLFTGGDLSDAAWPAFAALGSGALLLPILGVGVLPLVEWAFGYVTDLKLLELANLNHPALKDLIVQAPGTYHHSVIMGSLVEASAQAIGANPLLARVSAYYHDIGKTVNPSWFAENQRGDNRHDQAAPAMSAKLVKRHVTDGMELARRWKLPRVVADVIPQHHGTRLVSFFWAKALQAAEASDGAEPAELDEALYRYPGPKPQTREAALVMIADACEASARALPEPTPENLRAIVQRRIHEIFAEGQLDECPLTLKDLGAIATSMARALEAVYHARPDYPGRAPVEGPPPPLQLVMKS